MGVSDRNDGLSAAKCSIIVGQNVGQNWQQLSWHDIAPNILPVSV